MSACDEVRVVRIAAVTARNALMVVTLVMESETDFI